MPKRSNDFQRLVTLIEGQLAPIGATVEESAVLFDASHGQQREIDILIRYPVGQRVISVGIECRDHKRKADSIWIDQLRGKFETLPIDRVVAVSRSGFYRHAKERAKFWKIETITLQNATKVNWASTILSLSGFEITGQHFTIEGFAISLKFPADHDDAETLGNLLYLPDGRTTSLLPFLERLVKKRESADAFLQMAPKVDNLILNMGVEFPHDCPVFLGNPGRQVLLTKVEMEVRCNFIRLQGFFQYGEYGEVAVAFGSGMIKEILPFNFALTECKVEGLKGGLSFGGKKVECQIEVVKRPVHENGDQKTPSQLDFSVIIPVTAL